MDPCFPSRSRSDGSSRAVTCATARGAGPRAASAWTCGRGIGRLPLVDEGSPGASRQGPEDAGSLAPHGAVCPAAPASWQPPRLPSLVCETCPAAGARPATPQPPPPPPRGQDRPRLGHRQVSITDVCPRLPHAPVARRHAEGAQPLSLAATTPPSGWPAAGVPSPPPATQPWGRVARPIPAAPVAQARVRCPRGCRGTRREALARPPAGGRGRGAGTPSPRGTECSLAARTRRGG